MKNINAQNHHKKTKMEQKSEFAYFKEVFSFFSANNSPLYLSLHSMLDSEEIFLFDAIAKFNPEAI